MFIVLSEMYLVILGVWKCWRTCVEETDKMCF